MIWKIRPTDGGYWLFIEGVPGAWMHVYRDKWFPIFPTLKDVFQKIKERT